MIRSGSTVAVVSTIGGISLMAAAPAAHAEDFVTYEVLSGSVSSVNVEYYDRSEPISLAGLPLPWRTNATVVNPSSQSTDGARLRANWRETQGNGWVTIRIFMRGSLICESTQTKGKASCYGNWPSLDGDLPVAPGGRAVAGLPDAAAP